MKKPKSVLEYPLVLRKVLDSISVSAPDLSIWSSLPLPPVVKKDNRYVTEFSDEYALRLGRAMIATWRKVDRHIQEKKWAPEASDIRSSVTKSQKALTLPAFVKLVNEHVEISEDSVRRDIDSGRLRAFKTSGGHRRISISELAGYLESLGKQINLLG